MELFIPILNFALVWPEKQKVSGTGSRNLLSCKKGEPKWGRGAAGHLSTRQYARLLAGWLAMIDLDRCSVWHAFTPQDQGYVDL